MQDNLTLRVVRAKLNSKETTITLLAENKMRSGKSTRKEVDISMKDIIKVMRCSMTGGLMEDLMNPIMTRKKMECKAIVTIRMLNSKRLSRSNCKRKASLFEERRFLAFFKIMDGIIIVT